MERVRGRRRASDSALFFISAVVGENSVIAGGRRRELSGSRSGGNIWAVSLTHNLPRAKLVGLELADVLHNFAITLLMHFLSRLVLSLPGSSLWFFPVPRLPHASDLSASSL